MPAILNLLPGLAVDLRLGLRRLTAAPAFAVTALVCLALGIGANTALFSLSRALLGPSPHVAEPDRLVRVFVDWDEGLDFGAFSYPDFVDVQERSGVFEGFAAETPTPVALAVGERSRRLWGSVVSGSYFAVLGVPAAHGRMLRPDDAELPHGRTVVVVSHRLWRSDLGGDPAVVGTALRINGRPFTVVGVAPAGFQGPNAAIASDLWLPLTAPAAIGRGTGVFEARGHHWLLFAVGRLRPGVGPAEAQAALDVLMAHLAREHPEAEAGKRFVVYPEARAALHPVVRGGFVSFLAAISTLAGLLLALVCVDLAGLQLARAVERRRETSLRMALGAGRARIARQLLVEGLLHAGPGGAAGLLLALALARALTRLDLPIDTPLGIAVPIDPVAFGFAAGLTALVLIALAAAPALAAARLEARGRLRAGFEDRGGTTVAASRLRGGLIVAQVALALVLLLGAGLFVRLLGAARDVNLGFATAGRLVVSLDAGLAGYSAERGQLFFDRLEERVRALPGVEAAGWSRHVPLSLQVFETPLLPEGYEPPAGSPGPTARYDFVGPGYFQALGIPLLAGEGLGEERAGAPAAHARGPETRASDELAPAPRSPPAAGFPPAVVNRTFARRFWPGESGVGRSVEALGRTYRVIGVVGDVQSFRLGEAAGPFLYLPIARHYQGDRTLHVRVRGEAAAWLAPVREEVERLDPAVPLYALRPLADHVRFALLPARLGAALAAAFAGLALVLAAAGLFGLLSETVARREREIGVRLALGARPAAVGRMITASAARLVAAGLGLGLAAAWGLSRLLATVVYGVATIEPWSAAIASGVLAGAALLASWPPARRAVTTDPARALRADG